MRGGSRRWWVWLAAALLQLVQLTSTAWAQEEAPPGPTGPVEGSAASDAANTDAQPEAPAPVAPQAPPVLTEQDQALQTAKELFLQGNAIREAGDCQRALDFYQRSRALAAAVPNTLNAAYCLKELKRLDEALEMYEEALARFRDSLSPAQSELLSHELQELRGATASLEVSANVNGALVVDGRQRGRLPLAGPVRLMPGQRTVRISHDGYVTFEVQLDLDPGQTRRLDAKLQPLASAGRARIDVPDGAGADVYIDGAHVGVLPWEGTLAPGRHLFSLVKGDEGTAPAQIIVVQGQTVPVSATLKPLGPAIRITVDPSGAELVLDRVALGSSTWQGRLPLGAHRAEATLEGYHPLSQEFQVNAGDSSDVTMSLVVDPNHPRWTKRLETHFWLEAFGGAALSPSLGTGAERTSGLSEFASGFAAGARGGLGIGENFSFELGFAWLDMSSALVWTQAATWDSDNEEATPPETVTYQFNDDHTFRGPLGSGGVSYYFPVLESLLVGARLHAGALYVSSTVTTTATLSSSLQTIAASVEGTGQATRSLAFAVWPELGARWRVTEHLHLALAVAGVAVLSEGAAHDTGDTAPVGACVTVEPAPPLPGSQSLECTQGNGSRNQQTNPERSFGPSIVITPTLGAGYTF